MNFVKLSKFRILFSKLLSKLMASEKGGGGKGPTPGIKKL